MSELTLAILRLALLALLWVFVFGVVGVLRGDLYAERTGSRRQSARARRRTARVGNAYSGTPAPAAVAAPAAVSGRREKGRRRQQSRTPTTVALVEGPLAGTTMPLLDSGLLIGRSPECTLVLDDDFASGRHARIYRSAQGWVVEDLGSTNGTFAGGPGSQADRVTDPLPLEVGSTVRIGQTVLELR